LLKYEEPRSLAGTIYTKERKHALYKFTRQATREGSRLKVLGDCVIDENAKK